MTASQKMDDQAKPRMAKTRNMSCSNIKGWAIIWFHYFCSIFSKMWLIFH